MKILYIFVIFAKNLECDENKYFAINCQLTPKTKTSVRDIPLNDTLIENLKEYQEWFRLADDDFDNNLDKYYLAVNMYREPIGTDTVGAWLRIFERTNGFKHVSCHGLRHTYCSLYYLKMFLYKQLVNIWDIVIPL